MFMKRGGANPAPPAPSTTPLPTSGVQPNQIPYVNPPLPSGPEEEITEEKVLADPTWAENQLHAALTVRALKWLDMLKQDETLNPQPGQRLVTLDTQVAMFNTLTNWLKVSKRTKEAGSDDEGAPGIEQMRQVIREEMALVKPTPPKPKLPPTLDGDEDEPPRQKKAGGFQKGNKAAATKPTEDDRQLRIMVSRAREASYEEN